jgi:phenylpropionate dioxygenase-like ring-hydroxylating dioxygenase large terminal subunit
MALSIQSRWNGSRIEAPAASRFPDFPASWYLWGRSRDLQDRPVSRTLFGMRLAAWRTSSGQPVVLSAHCSHFGADLGQGDVLGDRLRCPFHHWEYGVDGRCRHIPAQDSIPDGARQATWPVVERHGLLFVFKGPTPRFPLPFFPDCRPEDFVAARSFSTVLECPWYLVGANAFDVQHFRAAHDRRMVGEPVVDTPHPLARRAVGTFAVAGHNWRDRLTRRFAGDQVTLAITDWCGNLMFATATFRRTTSYGMVITEPLAGQRVLVRVFVFLPRSRGVVGRMLADPLRLEVRRYFIAKFLSEDAARLHGARYQPGGLVECDRHLVEYFQWLAEASSPGKDAGPHPIDEQHASDAELESEIRTQPAGGTLR